MRLTLFAIDGDDPLAWHMQAIRHYGFVSRVLNTKQLFPDGPLSAVKDRTYIEQNVIPRLLATLHSQQPCIELVKTKVCGINVGYDRIVLPQRNTGRPQWIISSTFGQFMLAPAKNQVTLDIADESIIQLLIEGATAKEIAIELNLSHRTVEHRLDRMKERFGASNVVHLTAMFIARHLGQTPSPSVGLGASLTSTEAITETVE